MHIQNRFNSHMPGIAKLTSGNLWQAVAVLRWGQEGTGPQILHSPPKFLDTVVLLLVELIGSIVISLKFRLAVVASQMMRGQAPKYYS